MKETAKEATMKWMGKNLELLEETESKIRNWDDNWKGIRTF